MFFSKDIIKMAIEGISDVHPFFGITYFSAKLHELPIGVVTTCSIDTWNKDFMNTYHKIIPDTTYYFQPFNSNSREKQWVNIRYPSTGLQAVNTQTFRQAFIHERASRTWGWADGYVAFLKNYVENFSHPIPAFFMAVWFLKDESFDAEFSPDEIKQQFYDMFHITQEEKDALFDDSVPNITDIAIYSETVISLADYQSFISLPPDMRPAEEAQAQQTQNGIPEGFHSATDLEEHRISGGQNVLLYGVPGSGKSWTIEHEYCSTDSEVVRLVFHPDYTNADFIGQILPVVDMEKQVTYEFTAGPFTTIIKSAYDNPGKEYILIIEEINRGNAPAIFGEVFQLLDRTVEQKAIEGISYPKGTSEYGVTHKNMAMYIYGDESHKIRIPSNLSIIGTMNTSDQNVFTLDTAFQRRWRMRLIENSFSNVRRSLKEAKILDTEVTWQTFCEKINSIIIGNKAKMASAEDKRLGVYFVHESDITFDTRALPKPGFPTLTVEYDKLLKDELIGELTDEGRARLVEIREAVMHNRMFPEKVIKYLWDDAFKFNPEALFDMDLVESLEQVINVFVYSRGRERFKIFKNTVRSLLYPDVQA